jgi:hypothetical protein
MANSDEQVKLKNMFGPSPVKSKYKISFIFNKKSSSAIFTVDYKKDKISVENNCIKISYGQNKFSSLLKKNNAVKKCFEPALNVRKIGNENSEKNTMTDALQVLATKIKLAMGKGIIEIGDTATIDDISISPFRILRGQDTLYEKYGYESEALDEFKKYIKPLTWTGLMKIPGMEKMIRYFSTLGPLKEKLGGVTDEMMAIDVFRRISFDDEKATLDNNYDAAFSYNVYTLIKDSEFKFSEDYDPLVLYFNKDSDKWKKISGDIPIVSIERVMNAGGKTKKRKIRGSVK